MSWSNRITRRAAVNIIAAAHCSQHTRPLNQYLTVNHLTTNHDRPQPVVTSCLKYIGDWLRYHEAHPIHALWVLENPEPASNTHVHMLLHIPQHLISIYRKRLRAWLRNSGVQLTPRVLKPAAIYDLWHLVGYILKGLAPADYAALRLDPSIAPCPQGSIFGKRCGVSEAIGRASRKKSRFVVNELIAA